MYDRYTISTEIKALEKAFDIQIPKGYQPYFNASPTRALPIITSKDKDQGQIFQWGFISNLSNNKTISPKLFNLPALSAFERPTYRKSMENSRCVILADGFFAWKQVSKKQRVPNYFYFNNRAPFGIAGIWEESEDIDGNKSQSFNMLTIPADSTLASYQDDMPFILLDEQRKIWLEESTGMEDLEALMKNTVITGLQTHPVSPLISNPDRNDELLIKPAPPSDQFGNYTLFN